MFEGTHPVCSLGVNPTCPLCAHRAGVCEMDERTFTYDELATALGKSHEATRAMCIRKRWRRTIGNDGKARITVPIEAVEAHRTPDVLRAPTPSHTEHTGCVPQDTSAEPSADARTLIAVLQDRIGELQGRVTGIDIELKEARSTIAELTLKAARVDVLEALLDTERKRVDEIRESERQHIEEWKAVADRFATQAEKLADAAEARRSWWPFRRRA
jgi:hypothetical protein